MMFPPDYQTSRQQFREAATRLDWSLHAQPIPGEGPDGEELTIDAAISPNQHADRVLVVSSGLHGVEAPFGAAVQLAAMADWTNDIGLPSGIRCVFLHALNPYGFAWCRRFDADNVDPNRNFLLAGEDYSGSPNGYRGFDALLNPKRPPSRCDFFTLRASWLLMRYGLPALKEALVVGQYEFPQGIFFGGFGPCATNVALRQSLPRWIGRARRAVHLDFHTGLGKYGSYKLLLESPPMDGWCDRLDRWFGPGTYEEDNPNGVAYLPRGSFGPWCIAQQLADEYVYMTAEFGTYSGVTMMSGVRAENQAHHWGRPDGPNERRARTQLKEVFCPADPAWRERVLFQGVELVRRAAAGLREPICRPVSAYRERAA
jgi:hypothetical protein